MFSASCALLFALCALAASGTIVSSLRAYAGDILVLRSRIRQAEPTLAIQWRIVETGNCEAVTPGVAWESMRLAA